MLRIGISYINSPNVGDQIVFHTSEYLIKKCLKESNSDKFEIEPIDVRLYYGFFPYETEYFMHEKKAERRSVLDKLEITDDPDEKKKLNREYRHLKRQFLRYDHQGGNDRIKDLDIMVIAGGNITEQKGHDLIYFIDDITETCDANNIPVIINGISVSCFNGEDPDFIVLREALTRKCVKYISATDNIEIINEYYTSCTSVVTESVCDPGFWIKEAYRIEESENRKKIAGLNCIRPRMIKEHFSDQEEPGDQEEQGDQEDQLTEEYEYTGKEFLAELYHDLIIMFTERGYQVELFVNEEPKDIAWCNKIIESFEDIKALSKENAVTAYYGGTSRRFIKRISQYERFFSAWPHSALTGQVLGVPYISADWKDLQNKKASEAATEIFKALQNAEAEKIDNEYKMTVYKGLSSQLNDIIMHNKKA